MAEQLGHLDVMEADLRAVLGKKPDDPAALNALGFSLAEHRLDRLDEAESYIKQAMEKRPGDPAILDSYGWVLYRKGQRDQALVYLRKAYKLFADPEIAAHLGEVLWEAGQKAEARRVWAEGQKKNPDQEDMKRVREKYPEGFGGTGK
jgi:Flp pilus assembly protein TadD